MRANNNLGVMKIVIVEDHELLSQLLRGALNTIDGVRVVATARSVDEGIKVCNNHDPECLILDLGLPDGDGITVGNEAAKKNPNIKIIILSGHASTMICPRKLQDNVHAVVDKKRSFSMLESKLRELIELENGVRDGILPARKTPREERLTRKEMVIYELLGAGRTNKQIAEEVKITENTVKTHRRNIAAKLGLHGPDLLVQAFRFNKKISNKLPS